MRCSDAHIEDWNAGRGCALWCVARPADGVERSRMISATWCRR